MKKKETKYGVIDIPQGTIICTMEKGGDKDNKAGYRFSNSGKRTDSRIVALVTDETVMQDVYGDDWAHTKEGWIKTGDNITWYQSYKEAANALASKTRRKRRIIRIIIIAITLAAVGYTAYKIYKNHTIQPITPIPDETVSLD